MVNYALAAIHHYKIDQHYVVLDGKVQIIDEFTGRIAEGRSWQHGLHQLIEAKEGCEITGRHQTQTSITYQRFFRRYLHLCGMSGTISEVAGELRAVYDVPVVKIPTHRAQPPDVTWNTGVQYVTAKVGRCRRTQSSTVAARDAPP